MSKSSKGRASLPPKVGAVSDEMLARYKRARRVPSTREEVRATLGFLMDHATLTAVGEPAAASGAAMEAIDVALRLASTPASSDDDLAMKTDFLERQFGPFAVACGHPHVMRIVAAALAADRALGSEHRRIEHVPHASSNRKRSSRRVVDPVAPGAAMARLRAYAEGGETVGEVRGVLMAMVLVLDDRRTLSREGRARTLVGAERFFCGLLRRLCVTKATLTEWAGIQSSALSAAKDEMLGEDGLLQGQTGARALLVAMIDAAIGIEGEESPEPPSLH